MFFKFTVIIDHQILFSLFLIRSLCNKENPHKLTLSWDRQAEKQPESTMQLSYAQTVNLKTDLIIFQQRIVLLMLYVTVSFHIPTYRDPNRP